MKGSDAPFLWLSDQIIFIRMSADDSSKSLETTLLKRKSINICSRHEEGGGHADRRRHALSFRGRRSMDV